MAGGPGPAPDPAVGADEYGGLKGLAGEGWRPLALLRLFAIILITLPTYVFQSLVLLLRLPGWWVIPLAWHRLASRILGFQVVRRGCRARGGPVLYVANHISWADIIVLGGLLPGASFVAKAEVAGWGLFGHLAGLHRTLYIRRQSRHDSARQRDALAGRVAAGDSLILFPEGTSTDGMRVDPFKSALFSVAERADEASHHHLQIQPVTIAYTEVNGIPMVRSQKPWVAWLGDVELVRHFKDLLGRARHGVTVEFHPPMTLAEAGDRKHLARACEVAVRAGLERALRSEQRLGPQSTASGEGN